MLGGGEAKLLGGLGGGDAVDLAGGELDEALRVLAALLHDLHVLRVVQVVDAEGISDVERRVGEGDQIDDDVGLGDELVDLCLVFGNIEIEVGEIRMANQVLNFLVVNVEGGDFVHAICEQALGQVDADEASGS